MPADPGTPSGRPAVCRCSTGRRWCPQSCAGVRRWLAESRLARAGLSDHGEHLTGLDLEAHSSHSLHTPGAAEGDLGVIHPHQRRCLDEFSRHGALPSRSAAGGDRRTGGPRMESARWSSPACRWRTPRWRTRTADGTGNRWAWWPGSRAPRRSDAPAGCCGWRGSTRGGRRVAVPGIRQHLAGRAGLDDAAGVHDGDPVGDVADDAEIVADEHESEVLLVLQPLQQLEDLGLDRGVDSGRRLVGKQEGGPPASAIAITARCRIPPDIWWGNTSTRASGSEISTLRSRSIACSRASRRLIPGCARAPR